MLPPSFWKLTEGIITHELQRAMLHFHRLWINLGITPIWGPLLLHSGMTNKSGLVLFHEKDDALYCTSDKVFYCRLMLSFSPWHLRQSNWRFSKLCVPPMLIGMMWSTLSFFLLPHWLHLWLNFLYVRNFFFLLNRGAIPFSFLFWWYRLTARLFTILFNSFTLHSLYLNTLSGYRIQKSSVSCLYMNRLITLGKKVYFMFWK